MRARRPRRRKPPRWPRDVSARSPPSRKARGSPRTLRVPRHPPGSSRGPSRRAGPERGTRPGRAEDGLRRDPGGGCRDRRDRAADAGRSATEDRRGPHVAGPVHHRPASYGAVLAAVREGARSRRLKRFAAGSTVVSALQGPFAFPPQSRIERPGRASRLTSQPASEEHIMARKRRPSSTTIISPTARSGCRTARTSCTPVSPSTSTWDTSAPSMPPATRSTTPSPHATAESCITRSSLSFGRAATIANARRIAAHPDCPASVRKEIELRVSAGQAPANTPSAPAQAKGDAASGEAPPDPNE